MAARRGDLVAAVLDYQGGKLQDDASLLLVDWAPGAHARMFPTLPGQAPG